jgi:hypothetical protein
MTSRKPPHMTTTTSAGDRVATGREQLVVPDGKSSGIAPLALPRYLDDDAASKSTPDYTR